MISYEEAGRVLDEAVDALPSEIFDKLNGGVNLIRSSRTDEHGLLVMGTYNVNQMGRYIEIYYGSFSIKFPDAAPEKCERELVHTLKHELTHHIENLAMDRSLEKWDEQHVAELLGSLSDEGYEPLEVDSILFVDEDGSGLAEMAESMFRTAAEDNGIFDISSASASASSGPLNLKAARAVARFGLQLNVASTQREVTRELCEKYDAVLCTTLDLADELAGRWPDLSDKIMCLGDDDLRAPMFDMQLGWNRLADATMSAVNQLVEELLGSGEEDD